jgi:SAM-dependent methyltransferase
MNPHASWAEFYDGAYEDTFGPLYSRMTDQTVREVLTCLPSPARIVDFGAGTGRIAVPLAGKGYQVLAVEPCREMLEQLSNKPGGEKVETFCGKIEEFDSLKPFGMAICIFTVLIYILDEGEMEKSIEVMGKAIKSDGYLLIDIPTRALFGSGSFQGRHFYRTITIDPAANDLYRYKEKTQVRIDGQNKSYSDEFDIRFWQEDYVMSLMRKNGLTPVKDLSGDFSGTWSHYFLMRKSPASDPTAHPV